MIKGDESELAAHVLEACGDASHIAIAGWEVARQLGMHYKRARYLFRDKWADREWWDYGVSWRHGWLTPAGVDALRSI